MKSEVSEVSFESLDLAAAVGVIGGKWKVRIICLLLGGTKQFGELRRSLTGVHRGTLTYELRGLEADGIIQRTQYMTIPPTVEYKLTARGTAPQTSHHCTVAMDSDRQRDTSIFNAREAVNYVWLSGD